MKNKAFRLVALFLAVTAVLLLSGCKKNTAPPADSKFWAEVQKTEKPAPISGSYMTEQELENTYGKYFDWRVYEIRTTDTEIKPAEGASSYYVSPFGDDSADGKTPETAIKTLTAVQKLSLKSGDAVYFERGGVWRGTLNISTDGVSFSAYGEGKKPEIYASPLNAANPEYWEETETPNVYKFTQSRLPNVGVLVLDDKEFGVKCFWENGNYGKKKPSELENHLDFMVDTKSELYFKCEKGNPGEVWDKIEINVGKTLVPISADNVTIDNLCFKYTGNHCVSGNDITGLTVQNCEFGFIGGSMQGGEGSNVRYGNAVEIWGEAVNFTVKNNYFYEIYDSAATFQYRNNKNEPKNTKNVLFANNVFYHCTASIEYWNWNGGTIDNFTIDNNFLWKAGYGLGSQRPSRSGSISLTSGGMDNIFSGPVNFKNNIIAISSIDLIYMQSKSGYYPTLSGNTYIQRQGGRLGIYNSEKAFRFDENIKNVIENHLGDKTATVVTVKQN